MAEITPPQPLYFNKFLTGLYTNRSALDAPLASLGIQYVERKDVLIDGLNVEISPILTLQRSPGFLKFSTQQLGSSDIPRRFYSWRDLNSTIRIVSDFTDIVAFVQASSIGTIITPSITTAPCTFQGVGSTLYGANGNQQFKWNGLTQPTTPILSQSNTAGVFTGAQLALVQLTLVNATGHESLPSTTSTITPAFHKSFDITSPAAQTGVVSYNVYAAIGSGPTLLIGNTAIGVTTGVSAIISGTNPVPTVDGLVAPKWGITTPPTAPTITPAAGSLSPQVGYSYVYCYKNSDSQHFSSASPFSANTGPQTSKQFSVAGTNSSDTQVDKVDVFRTKDGGSVYFFCGEVANAPSWSFTDTVTDANLDTTQIAPVALINSPPPATLANVCFHMGRMWGSAGNKVYYAAGPDSIIGVPEECWPPANYFTFPSSINALLPTSFGLLACTASTAYLIRGVDSQSFFPQTWQEGLGVLSQNCLIADGDDIYIYTSNAQLFVISKGVIEEIGFAIGDQLLSLFSSASTFLTPHRSGSTDAALYASDGSTNIARYSFQNKTWATLRQPVGGVGAIKSCEVSAGSYKLLAGRPTASGYILKRDLSTFTDDGSTYSGFATIGSLVLAPPQQLVEVESVLTERTAAGTEPTISVLPNEISGSFTTLSGPVNEPPQLAASSTVIAKRYYLENNATAMPTLMRHLQVKITLPTENAKNEIMGLAITPKAREQ